MPNNDYYDGSGPAGSSPKSDGWLPNVNWDGILGVIGGGAQAGFGLGDAASGMAGNGGFAEVGKTVGRAVARGAQDAYLDQYPGYGELWTYGAGGIGVTSLGWAAVAIAGAAIWLAVR